MRIKSIHTQHWRDHDTLHRTKGGEREMCVRRRKKRMRGKKFNILSVMRLCKERRKKREGNDAET
jgi:hypothetical protein